MPIYRLTGDLLFPPPHLAEDGLLAVGGDLSVQRLLLAYRHGIFPWYTQGDPILWWSPDPRMILTPQALHRSRRLKRTLRQDVFRVTMDQAFARVIRACATVPRPKQDAERETGAACAADDRPQHSRDDTWITEEMEAAYIELHRLGYAHSVEAWHGDTLAGGLYGVSLGGAFFGESMFSRRSNASKVALATAMAHFEAWGIELVDCQVANAHLARLGAYEVPRRQFLRMLERALRAKTRRGVWRLRQAETETGN